MINFDRRINTSLAPHMLWVLMKQAIESPEDSPIWPVELEHSEPLELSTGATIQATYKVGPIPTQVRYIITNFDEQGRTFSYKSSLSHPLKGGATLEVTSHQGGSTLRWHGSYRPRLHLLAPAALLFVKIYFLKHFFRRLEENLRHYRPPFEFRESPRDSLRG